MDICPQLHRACACPRPRPSGLDIVFRVGAAEALPFPDAASILWPALSAPHSLRGPSWSPPKWRASAVPAASIAMATGPRKASSARCSSTIASTGAARHAVAASLGRRSNRRPPPRSARSPASDDTPPVHVRIPVPSGQCGRVLPRKLRARGPRLRALDGQQRRALRAELDALWTRHNQCSAAAPACSPNTSK